MAGGQVGRWAGGQGAFDRDSLAFEVLQP